jgi:hypothetical protein
MPLPMPVSTRTASSSLFFARRAAALLALALAASACGDGGGGDPVSAGGTTARPDAALGGAGGETGGEPGGTGGETGGAGGETGGAGGETGGAGGETGGGGGETGGAGGETGGSGGTAGAMPHPEVCEVEAGAPDPEFLAYVGCRADFERLASAPLSSTLPGARSTKVVYDRQGGSDVFYQNSVLYPLHYDFASAHLSGNGRPIVGALADFNASEYFSPDRRFILGAVTYYEGPARWALELSPYDTASAALIEILYRAASAAAFFGPVLAFHPTSDAVAVEAARLPADIPIVTTDELFAGIDYQPLSLGAGVGRLRFVQSQNLENEFLSYDDLVVIDQVPNDITPVRGLISETFQTPLSHVNVLAQNRGTPNMGLRGAMEHPDLRALEGRLVELTVGAAAWSVREVSEEEAQAFWDAHRPAPVTLPPLDLGPTDLRDLDAVTPEPGPGESLRDKIREAVRAFGGKSAHYSILRRTEGVPIRPAFAVPMYYYDQFMRTNGFYDRIAGFLADPVFMADIGVRETALALLRSDMQSAAVDEGLQTLLREKMEAQFPGRNMRFRTSTNSEDLDGFPCAGCYESHTGDFDDWNDVLDAIRETYASAWLLRTFEERTFYGVDHETVGMALLVHPNFPDEEANGVAVTNNPFAPSGQDPAFFVNVQQGGDVEVVAPPPGVTSDQFLYYFTQPNQPTVYLSHSSLVAPGDTVLTGRQVRALGVALDAIQRRFSAAYGPAAGIDGWHGLDVEFKFDDEDSADGVPALWVKQARPYPRPE